MHVSIYIYLLASELHAHISNMIYYWRGALLPFWHPNCSWAFFDHHKSWCEIYHVLYSLTIACKFSLNFAMDMYNRGVCVRHATVATTSSCVLSKSGFRIKTGFWLQNMASYFFYTFRPKTRMLWFLCIGSFTILMLSPFELHFLFFKFHPPPINLPFEMLLLVIPDFILVIHTFHDFWNDC